MSDAAEFHPQVKFVCPWCKLEVMAGEDPSDHSPLVFHEEPPCNTFIELPIDEFMHRSRVYFENNKPN